MPKLRVFLVDDHAIVREGLKTLINAQSDMTICGEAANGTDAIGQMEGVECDVMVMDISMPHMGGAEATRRLHTAYPQIAVLVLSVHEEMGYVREMMQAGARGYVLKRAVAETVIGAIRSVADGGTYLDPALSANLVAHFGTNAPPPVILPTALSERETVVVRLTAQGYSNKEIAAHLDLSVKTVETYKARAMEKLNLEGRVALVRYAMQHGLLDDRP